MGNKMTDTSNIIAFLRLRGVAGLWVFLSFMVFPAYAASETLPKLIDHNPVISATTMGVVINTRDPLSVKIGEYYQQQHGIPPKNVIRISFEPGQAVMPRAKFSALYKNVKANTPDTVQAYALTWMMPFRVDCMSITSAFAFGFDEKYCASGCKTTKFSRYFASASHRPWTDLGIRPTMALAGTNFASVKAVIDRGVASIESRPPKARAYLLKTSDKNRSVRKISEHAETELEKIKGLTLDIPQLDTLKFGRNVMFYFTGSTHVADIASNSFLPGAIGDHLTSTGGVLNGTGQMSAVRWLEGGATGSYGTVVEPCNFTTKFPDPTLVIGHYTMGEPLIQAYWKSVAMPGQGIFIGDPLANPWGGYTLEKKGDRVRIEAARLSPGNYTLLGAPSASGPYRIIVPRFTLPRGDNVIDFPDPRGSLYYVIKRAPS